MNDITGKKFGKLTALYSTQERKDSNGCVIWVCKCDCGRVRKADESSLISGNIRQCRECARHRRVG